MAGENNFGLAFGVDGGEDIAVAVTFDFIGELGHAVAPDPLPSAFEARGGRCVEEFVEESKAGFVHNRILTPRTGHVEIKNFRRTKRGLEGVARNLHL